VATLSDEGKDALVVGAAADAFAHFAAARAVVSFEAWLTLFPPTPRGARSRPTVCSARSASGEDTTVGLSIALQDEIGDKLAIVVDPKNLFGRLLPDPADASFVCLRFIDPYQDTTFNQWQMEPFIHEMGRVATRATTAEQKQILDGVVDLARRCAAEPHLYLKFYGD
jgi:hypothetical protein